jgi:hypothetical protein
MGHEPFSIRLKSTSVDSSKLISRVIIQIPFGIDGGLAGLLPAGRGFGNNAGNPMFTGGFYDGKLCGGGAAKSTRQFVPGAEKQTGQFLPDVKFHSSLWQRAPPQRI